MYYTEAKVVANAVTEELIRLGACANPQACQTAQMVLWEGGGWKLGPFQGGGVSVEVYRVSDVAVANALVERCRKLHAQNPNVPVSIVVHANAHIDNLHPGTPVVVKQARLE
jgi:hypothetical protein